MNKKYAVTALATALAVGTGSAYAGDCNKFGKYIGATIGNSMAYKGLKYHGKNASNNGATFGIVLGLEQKIIQRFSMGFETGFQYAHEYAVGDHYKSSLISISMMLTTKYFIFNTQGIHVFLKGGLAINSLETDYYNPPPMSGPPAKFSNVEVKPVGAIGVGYQVDNWSVFGQYQHNWLDSNYHNTDKRMLGTISIGLTYTV